MITISAIKMFFLYCEAFKKNQTAFKHSDYAYPDTDALIKLNGEKYFADNFVQARYEKLARYHACMGHYKAQQFSNRPLIAIAQFKLSVKYFNLELKQHHSTTVTDQLKIELAKAYLAKGRLYLRTVKNHHADSDSMLIKKADSTFVDGMTTIQSLSLSCEEDTDDLLDDLLREHAEACYLLDNFYMQYGDSLAYEFKDALECGFNKCIAYGEEAIRSLNKISSKSKNDQVSLQKTYDKLSMSYGAAHSRHASLAQICPTDSESATFHQEESQRLRKLMMTIIDRPDAKSEELVPQKHVSSLFYANAILKPLQMNDVNELKVTNGVNGTHSANGTNGTNGTHSTNGSNGTNGSHGTNGKHSNYSINNSMGLLLLTRKTSPRTPIEVPHADMPSLNLNYIKT